MPGRLAVILTQIDGLLTDDAWQLSDSDLDGLLEGIGRLDGRLAAVNSRLITEAGDRGFATRAGASDTAGWLRDRLALSTREARRQVTLAHAIADGTCEATGAALARGELTADHAHVIREALTFLPDTTSPYERAAVEQTLLDHARIFDPYRLVRLAARIREHLTRVDTSPGGDDPHADSRTGQPGDQPTTDDGNGGDRGTDGDSDSGGGQTADSGPADDEHRPSPDPAALRRLTFTDTSRGTTLVHGELDAEGAALLRTALDSLAAPTPSTDGAPDPRSPQRRRADALVELAARMLTSAAVPASGGVRPHLTVHIPWNTLIHGGADPATTAWGLPLPRSTLARLTCDAAITRILLDPAGAPLDVGHSTRVTPPHIRRALIARDHGCAFPGCDIPPAWTESHHILHWLFGGPTALDNLVLLCGRHHRQVHHDAWTIVIEDDRRPSFIPPRHIDPHQQPRRNPYSQPVPISHLLGGTAAAGDSGAPVDLPVR